MGGRNRGNLYFGADEFLNPIKEAGIAYA